MALTSSEVSGSIPHFDGSASQNGLSSGGKTTARLRPSTRRGYWQILQNHVLPEFGDRALSSIDFMDVERFVATKLAEGALGPKKIRDCVSVISLVMQAAIRSGARRDNPAAGHHVPVRCAASDRATSRP
jgi:hypothetical protein